MRKIALLVVVSMMLVTTTVYALERTLAVAGRGAAKITPRQATIMMTAQSSHTTSAQVSSSTNAQLVASIKARLLAIPGVTAPKVSLGSASTTPRYKYDDNGNPSFDKWVTTQSVTVKVKAKGAANLLGQVYAAGAQENVMVAGPDPIISDKTREKAMQRAEVQAIKNAKLRATKMAKAAGMSLGDVMQVQDEAAPSAMPYRARSMALESASADVAPEFTINPETITQSRTVIFELLPK